MFKYLLIIFTVIPLTELFVLLRVGRIVGAFNTILIVVITGIIGASLARYQGLVVIYRIKEELSNGRIPAQQLLDGLFILIAGILLITPGILTDILGFLLLTPMFRGVLRLYIQEQIRRQLR